MRYLLLYARYILLCWLGFCLSSVAAPIQPVQIIHDATLYSSSGWQTVRLPHQLEADNIAPEGEHVLYKLAIDLPELPSYQLGIYIQRVSMAGRLFLNGKEVGICELGYLEKVRCINKPYLFLPPLEYWKAGENLIEIDVYASA